MGSPPERSGSTAIDRSPMSPVVRAAGSKRLGPAGLAILACLLGGCAGGPGFPDLGASPATPREAVTEAAAGQAPARVLWGGRILSVEYVPRATELLVEAHPLDATQRPRISDPAQGRFLVHAPRYLDPETWRAGRLVTVSGPLTGLRPATALPVVETSALHLWTGPLENLGLPRFRIHLLFGNSGL